MAPPWNSVRALVAAAAVWATLPTTTARAASEPPATKSPAAKSSSQPSPGQAQPPHARTAGRPRSARYVQVVAKDAAILAAPGGTVVAWARRGTVLEFESVSKAGYAVLLHSGQPRLLPQKAAQPVLYRPLEVDDPTLRQQVLAAIVEAQSRAQQEAQARGQGGSARSVLARVLADRYALDVAQRYSLNPPVVSALAAASGLAETAASP